MKINEKFIRKLMPTINDCKTMPNYCGIEYWAGWYDCRKEMLDRLKKEKKK